MAHVIQMYATYDRKAAVYLAPFFVQHEPEALRAFTEAVVSSDTPLSQYPADFDLFRIGNFELETGHLDVEPHPVPVINGLVALTASQAERRRYQSILNPTEDEIPQAS